MFLLHRVPLLSYINIFHYSSDFDIIHNNTHPLSQLAPESCYKQNNKKSHFDLQLIEMQRQGSRVGRDVSTLP